MHFGQTGAAQWCSSKQLQDGGSSPPTQVILVNIVNTFWLIVNIVNIVMYVALA